MVNEKIEQIRKILGELQDSSCRFGQIKCEECEFHQPFDSNIDLSGENKTS